MTYDTWKTTNPHDALLGPEPPPCEWAYHGTELHNHPRYPSGYCVKCGAQPNETCKHEAYSKWEEWCTDDEQLRYETETNGEAK